MTIVIGTVAAPWGPIRVAASERGVVAIEQLVAEEEFRARMERRFGAGAVASGSGDAPARAPARAPASAPAAAPADEHLGRAIRALRAFVDGDLGALEALAIDLSDRSEWDRRVLAAVCEIPPGATASYGDVARMAGKPGAARAAGGAVGRNPVGLAIPCHRVIAGDGSLGGYGGGWWGGREAGLALKRQLLAREGVHVQASRTEG